MIVGSINPTREQIDALAASLPTGQPFMMLNLLTFRKAAAYPPESDDTPCTGREAYERYAREALPRIAACGGELLLSGPAGATVIGPDSERWDAVFIVRYPHVRAFMDMLRDPGYQAVTRHRTAALADSRLIAFRAGDLDGVSASGN
jgi:uncharacterized protein (DUF1330 family)